MKFLNLPTLAVLCVIALFSACKNDAATSKDSAVETPGALPAPDATTGTPFDVPAPGVTPGAAPAPTTTPEPAQNASGVWHYTCSKGCAGGGGSAAPCAKCGTMLAHNTAYHGAANPAPAPSVTPTTGNADKTTVQVPPASKPEPPQNKAGVWHYTCADGCAGGSGSASPCAKCSKPLTHNTAYHQ